MAEGNETVDPALLDVEFQIDRGAHHRGSGGGNRREAAGEPYLRTRTPSLVLALSRACPAISTWPRAMSTTRMGC